VAAGAANVQTVAIINPDSGPGTGPDSNYNTYMAKLNEAGVEMIGYVHTSYGARALADVQADIDQYAAEFPLLVGIFLDEAADTADQVPYYTTLYSYIMNIYIQIENFKNIDKFMKRKRCDLFKKAMSLLQDR